MKKLFFIVSIFVSLFFSGQKIGKLKPNCLENKNNICELVVSFNSKVGIYFNPKIWYKKYEQGVLYLKLQIFIQNMVLLLFTLQ